MGRWWEGLAGPHPEAFSKACGVAAEALEWRQSWHLRWLAATRGRHLALPVREGGVTGLQKGSGLDSGIRVHAGAGGGARNGLRLYKDGSGGDGQEGNEC